jgi:hypothetical protein
MINLYTAGGLVDVIEQDSLCDNEMGARFDGAYISHKFDFKIDSIFDFDVAVRIFKKVYNIKQIKRVVAFSLNSDNLSSLIEQYQNADI